MYKVRFHLAAGEHYRQWQVKHGDSVQYYKPEECTLHMLICELHNNSRVAQKIYDGANKEVCAWIECEILSVSDKLPLSVEALEKNLFKSISYNPRIVPFWTDENRNNLDNELYLSIISDDRKLWAC